MNINIPKNWLETSARLFDDVQQDIALTEKERQEVAKIDKMIRDLRARILIRNQHEIDAKNGFKEE